MPGLTRKLLVFAAVDGLFLQPVGARTSDVHAGIRVEYGSNNNNNRIQHVSEKQDATEETQLEVHGIVGLLNLVSSSYLIFITKREQVAQIRQKPVFRITDVTLIPLSSQQEARKAIRDASALLKSSHATGDESGDGSDVGDEVETSTIGTEPDEQDLPDKQIPQQEGEALEPPKKSTTFVQDVVQKKGKFGRFASSWFSKTGSQSNVKREEGLSGNNSQGSLTTEQKKVVDGTLPEYAQGIANEEEKEGTTRRSSTEKRRQSAVEYLTPRILKSARIYFSSSGFYFSYDHNLSSSPLRRTVTSGSTPLWRQYDSLFFWNRHLAAPFVDAGQDHLVLPLIQGFVGQRSFAIAETEGQQQDVVAEAEGTELIDFNKAPNTATKHDFFVTLISRRSIKRAGLRYLRRGVDDQGNVANSVETEQILSPQDWDNNKKIFSLTQIRGSMPLFFSQSPYSFKPTPVIFGSETTNQAAFQKHFRSLRSRYGNLHAASLIDKHGTEVSIGEAYEKQAKTLNEHGGIDGNPLGFEWFDFHGECKGMKFENVSLLLHTLNDFLTTSGYSVQQNDQSQRQQSGVLRTNCMDCLDRTNVTQSAVGAWSLQQQLGELGLKIDLKTDPKTQWFNTLWADNGDAISKQYAGTSALKGDFTRTRKRNWAGALSDFSLTLNRYYNNIFGDYFLQTNIDYFLGGSVSVFDDFETDMTSQDYRIDMSQVRQNAIDTCVKIVLEDPAEDLLSAWTVSCPRQSNTLRSLPFEECVLLLTDTALYFCRFDWDTEKVGSFERVDLLDVQEIYRGAYVTSALGPQHMDEFKNHGFLVKYKNLGRSIVRTNTRSLSVSVETEEKEQPTEQETKDNSNRKKEPVEVGETRILAFKALPPKQGAEQGVQSLDEVEATRRITQEVVNAVNKATSRGSSSEGERNLEVQEKSIISAAEAWKATSYVESLGYSVKRLIWS